VKAWPEAKLAFSGGSGTLLLKSRVRSTNSDVALQLLKTLGISTEHMSSKIVPALPMKTP